MPQLNHKLPATTGAAHYSRFDLLRIYTFYRILLGATLLLMFQVRVDERLFGGAAPMLFYWTSLSYTLINVGFLLWMWRTRFQPSPALLFASLMVDAGAYMLLVHASGGALSGIAYLLLIAIAAGGIMLPRPLAILQASITSIAIVGESIYRYFFISDNTQSLFASSLLGCFSFAISLLFQYLAQKILQTQAEASLQAERALHSQRLAQLIIERMYTGIVVINTERQITLMNQAAEVLLNHHFSATTAITIDQLPQLDEGYQYWIGQQEQTIRSRQHQFTNDFFNFHFTELKPNTQGDLVVFIEDARAIQQHAQQLKLASLGRLTASIAHEVRNPLGAISHAAQLLKESDKIREEDERLLQIVQIQSKRVNSIIENVLSLSSRKTSNPTHIYLNEWLPEFINEYLANYAAKHHQGTKRTPNISLITLSAQPITVLFDESQLRQILSNLCDNGLRHTRTPDTANIEIHTGLEPQLQQPFIRIVDFGRGVSDDQAAHLFEPFFTTESTGSGLGLYICRELCEANQAFISYTPTQDGLSCFEIKLSHPKRSSYGNFRSIMNTAKS